MKFSVVVPAYCAEKSIGRCLESLVAQSFADFEAIVVDDGSSDETGKIVQTYAAKDPRVHYIYQRNAGVSTARNRGIREAKGEFLVFLDSDDRYREDYLDQFDKLIARYPDCDNFWCGYTGFDSEGHELFVRAWELMSQTEVVLDRSVIMSLHEKALDSAVWNKAFRKSILNEKKLQLDAELSLGEDLLFNYAYLDAGNGRIAVSSQPLYCYVKAENGSLDSIFRPDLLENYQKIHADVLSYLKKWGASPQQLAKYYSGVFFRLERVLYNTYRPECALTPAQKRAYNRAIVKSNAFQYALKHSDCRLNSLYRKAYELKSWDAVMLLDQLVRIKKKVLRR